MATSLTSKTAKFTFGCQSEENMLARSPQSTWQGQCFRYPLLKIGFKVLRENRYGPMEASMLHKCNRQINWRGWGQCFCALNQFLIGHVIGAKLLRSQYNHCRKCQICLFVLELTEWVRFKLKIWFTSHLYFNYVTKCYLFYNTKMCVCFNPLG